MSKILSDEDGDTIWNDPTPSITNIDDEVLSKVSQHWLKIIEGIADAKGGQEALDQYTANKIKEAELRAEQLEQQAKDLQLMLAAIVHQEGGKYLVGNAHLVATSTDMSYEKNPPGKDGIVIALTQLTNQYKGEQ